MHLIIYFSVRFFLFLSISVCMLAILCCSYVNILCVSFRICTDYFEHGTSLITAEKERIEDAAAVCLVQLLRHDDDRLVMNGTAARG